jgi:hypothetical protein
VREAHADLGTAMATLATEDPEYAQLKAKRLAVVAERFVARHFRASTDRGVTTDRTSGPNPES